MKNADLVGQSYEGTRGNVTYRCSPASYCEDKMQIFLTKVNVDKDDIFKGTVHRLLDALNARYARNRYIISPSKAIAFKVLLEAGWSAEMDWRIGGVYGSKEAPLFESPTGEKMTLKEALARIGA